MVSIRSLSPDEAKSLLLEVDTPPDDLVVNSKRWKLEGAYLTRKEAMESAEMFDTYRMFKFPQGYALYERSYEPMEEVAGWERNFLKYLQ